MNELKRWKVKNGDGSVEHHFEGTNAVTGELVRFRMMKWQEVDSCQTWLLCDVLEGVSDGGFEEWAWCQTQELKRDTLAWARRVLLQEQ